MTRGRSPLLEERTDRACRNPELAMDSARSRAVKQMLARVGPRGEY
jgi:hypothetical protein